MIWDIIVMAKAFSYYATIPLGVGTLICFFFTFVPLSLSFKYVSLIEYCYDKDTLIKWGVVGLFFINPISAILMLCFNDCNYYKPINKPYSQTQYKSAIVSSSTSSSLSNNSIVNKKNEYEKTLQTLKESYDNKLITEEQYKEAVNRVLEKFIK